jgi:hypothetical protein
MKIRPTQARIIQTIHPFAIKQEKEKKQSRKNQTSQPKEKVEEQ